MKSLFQILNLQKFLPAFLLLTLGLNAFSQGEFLHKGQSGMQLDGFFLQSKKILHIEDQGIIYSLNEVLNGYGGKIGFSTRGVIDLQLSINGWTLPSTSLYPKSKGTTVYARTVIHAVKQSDKFPFSVRAILGYGLSGYDEISTTDTDLDFGLGISRRTYLRDNISVVPTIDFLYSISNYTMDNADDITESGGIFVISLPIAFNLPRNHMIHLAPFINYGMNKSEGSYGFNLGYIIPRYRSTEK